MAEKIVNEVDQNILKDPLDYLPRQVKNSIFFSDIDYSEILTLISKLVLKKACGYDLITNRILKSTSYIISPFLAKLFNSCITQGVFPDAYKIAQVIPLYKGGGREKCDSYRPISLLPAIGKLLEKLIAQRLVRYFDAYDMFSPHQFGFRAKFSTEHAVLDIHEKILNNLDKRLNTCAIFLDLAKAFDSVSHNILLRKLARYGIRGNIFRFFQSYLSGRSQFVRINDVNSSLMNIEFGVPQGSILGPLLFLIFINDLPEATNFFIRLFADDTFLCSQNDDIFALESEVNIELNKVFIWLASNKLTLNISKSKYMLFSNKTKIDRNLNIKINENRLENCVSYKYLGVIFDCNLNWKSHIDRVREKVNKACGALSKLRHYVDLDTLKNVFYALVHSHLRYGVVVWGNAAENDIKPLHSLLNRVVRIMTFAPFGIGTQPIFEYLKILNLTQIFSLETGKFIYKSKNGKLPITTIANHFERASSEHGHNLRSRNNQPLITPFVLLSSFKKKSIFFRGSNLWDNISEESIKLSDSFNIFKAAYKLHLLENA